MRQGTPASWLRGASHLPRSMSCCALHLNDSCDTRQPTEVFRVARDLRNAVRCRHGSYEQIYCSGSAGFASLRNDSRLDQPVGAGGGGVEREGVECRLCPLKSILAACSLRRVCGGVRTGREFCHGDGRDCDFHGQCHGIDAFQVDNDGCVEESLRKALIK